MRRTIVASLQMSDEPFFLCVRDVLLVMFSNLYNAGAARGLSRARICARVRRFLFFAFTPSPVCPKLLSLCA